MSDGVSLRARGQRAVERRKGRDLIGPSIGLAQSGRPGEHRLNATQIAAIEQLYTSHPAITSARSILHGQLLNGGLALRRDGEDVELTPEFEAHLQELWIPYAADVIDSLLKWGYAVTVYEEDNDSLAKQVVKRRRTAQGDKGKGKAVERDVPVNLYPLVPPRETYDVAYVQGGRLGYKRQYFVYSQSPNHATKIDDEARVLVREHPDAAGNVISPTSKIFDLGSFAIALTELALMAEITLARPRIYTQQRKKDGAGALDPQNLFFDQESRGIQSSQDAEDNGRQVDQLAMQSQLCKIINSLQTRGADPKDDNNPRSFSGGGVAAGKMSHIPPEVPAALFSLPKDQEMANAAGQLPQARGDLESIQRLAIEQFCSAFGVPGDLLFNGRFASKSTAQLSLLNTTVAQLAKYVNQALTIAYRDIYGDGDGDQPVTLQLLTSPLAATEEVVNLYAAGLVPIEIAVPAVLNAIGATRDQIAKATEEAAKEAEEKKRCECEDREIANADAKLGQEERKQQMELNKAKQSTEAAQEAANVEKTKADTKKTLEEAKVAGKPKPAASGSSGSSGSAKK